VNSRQNKLTRELLAEVQHRLPAGRRLVQEAFTSDHRRPVLVKLTQLNVETFYLFDEITAHAFSDAVVELAARFGGTQLTLSYQFFGEFQAQQRRLQRIAQKLEGICVLAVGQLRTPSELASRVEFRNIKGNPLTRYRIALSQGAPSLGFVCRELPQSKRSDNPRSLGFFTVDPETVDDIADDIEQVARGVTSRLDTFQKLEMLHETTQRVARELDSYSRRMELAIQRARRRPDLLTPERFDRIVGQAIAKMEQLKEIPRRALRSLDRTPR
jgi:hypothetical protein